MKDIRTALKKLKKWILETCNLAWRGFCFRLPLKNRVFFYTIRANGALLDNIRCVYDALDVPQKVIFAHMLPHSAKIKPKLYFYLLTSKVIVTDDYVRYLRSVTLRPEQKVLQLWHASGAFKKFGLDAPSPLSRWEERKTHEQYTAVTVTSEGARQHYAHAFGITPNKCLPIGVARTDLLLSAQANDRLRESVFAQYPDLKGKRIYLYCPTFREKGTKRFSPETGLDFDALNASLGEDEVFIIRNHPVIKESLLTGGDLPRVRDCSGFSTLALIAACDVLITDYSSVIFDACLLGKPMVFFCPDIASYERSFYLDYPADLPGEAVTQPLELLDAVRRAKENPPLERLEAFRAEQMGACDGHSTERAVQLIKSWL